MCFRFNLYNFTVWTHSSVYVNDTHFCIPSDLFVEIKSLDVSIKLFSILNPISFKNLSILNKTRSKTRTATRIKLSLSLSHKPATVICGASTRDCSVVFQNKIE